VIDSRFSATAFTEADDDGRRTLADELQAEVTALLAPLIRAKLGEVAELLNEHGHRLFQAPLGNGAEEARLESPDDAAIRLYICHDSIVSAGTRAG
jgi:hypothetical protein